MMMKNVRTKKVEEDRKKRRLVFLTFGILLFFYLTLSLIIGENGLLRYINLKSVRSRLMAENKIIRKQNNDIESQVEVLRNEPDRVEELAREYGFTKEGELIFKFEDQK